MKLLRAEDPAQFRRARLRGFAEWLHIGTIGMRGAYTAMRHGWVGDKWAKEHHAFWYEDQRRQ